MTGRRYYPSTRERITRALDEGVKSEDRPGVISPYSNRNSGLPLNRAFWRGCTLGRFGFDPDQRALPVVDLSAEFADMLAEIEANPPLGMVV